MEPIIGTVLLYAGDRLPAGQEQYWMFCQGQSLLIEDYRSLYFTIGPTYGGNQTNFNLPDLQGRVAIGASAQGPVKPNDKGGEEQVTLTTSQLPQHTHIAEPASSEQYMQLSYDDAIREVPQAGDVPAAANYSTGTSLKSVRTFIDYHINNLVNGQSVVSGDGLEILDTGGNKPHENRQPYVALNYIIAVKGTIPERS